MDKNNPITQEEIQKSISVRWSVHDGSGWTQFAGGAPTDLTDSGFTAAAVFHPDKPGSYKIKAEVVGTGEAGKSLTVDLIPGQGPYNAAALPGDELNYNLRVNLSRRKYWDAAKLTAHLQTAVAAGKPRVQKKLSIPADVYCTKNVTWKELVGGQDHVPPPEVLERLARVAAQLQRYRDTVFAHAPVKITAGWESPEGKPELLEPKPATARYNLSSELERARGNGVRFTVKGLSARSVWKLLDPLHRGGLEILEREPKDVHLDLRSYYARLRVTPKGSRIFDRLSPPGCSCPQSAGEASRHEPDRLLPLADCRCLAEPEPAAGDEALAATIWSVQVGENPYALYTTTIQADAYGAGTFIQAANGHGATNLKSYAFHGAFLNVSEVNGSILDTKLGTPGFSERWLVRIPVQVKLRGNFKVTGCSSYGSGASKSTVVHLARAMDHSPTIESVEVSGYPASIGPAASEVVANTAGEGIAHGEGFTTKYTFQDVVVETGSLSSFSLPTIHIRYRYAVDGDPDHAAAITFAVLLSEGDPESYLAHNPDCKTLACVEPASYQPEEDTLPSLASRILWNPNIHLDEKHSESPEDNATARRNILDTIHGQEVSRTPPNQHGGVGGTTRLDRGILKVLLELSGKYKLGVSELAGGVHSKKSAHYDGLAFDISCVDGQVANAGNDSVESLAGDCRRLGARKVFWHNCDPDGHHKTHVHASFPPYQTTKEFWSQGVEPVYED
jgi:hypothetical protein